MALTFDDALTAVIGRLTAAGLNKARSPLGVRNESAPRLDRSFSVIPVGVNAPTQRGRERHRVGYRFRIELAHAVRPSDGLEAPDQALKDWGAAIKHLLVAGTALTEQGAIDIGATSHTYAGGGAFVLATFEITVTTDLVLAV